jgi:hypothetical protein
MLIATSLAAIVITISAPADVDRSLLDRITAEADAIWRSTGLLIQWERHSDFAAAGSLHVVVGRDRANATEYLQPLGWIRFDHGAPTAELYLSYANTITLLETSRGALGLGHNMTLLERNVYLSRAMGRALAHELGHYLLASTAHTRDGLMKANRSAIEFFSPDRRRFSVAPSEWHRITARLESEMHIASE